MNVSVTTFIPKAHTPFQWSPQISLTRSRQKIEWLRKQLKSPRVRFKWQKPEVSLVEGIFSRGDRRLSRLLVAAYEKGCRFDGWSDHFDINKWLAALNDTGLDAGAFTTRKRSFDEPLPWDHIDVRVSKQFLNQEWEKALDGRTTTDCRDGQCHQCGVCDFKTITPVVFTELKEKQVLPIARKETTAPTYSKVRLNYAKTGNARYFGHLEMVNIFTRAFRRARIALKFTQGFHPKPKLAFADPLPVGMESLNETLTIEIPSNTDLNLMIDRLNVQLPDGLAAIGASSAGDFNRPMGSNIICYQVDLTEGRFDRSRQQAFVDKEAWIHEKKTAKGKRVRLDAKKIVQKLTLSTDKRLTLCLHQEPGKSLRPSELLKSIFYLADKDVKQARIVKQ